MTKRASMIILLLLVAGCGWKSPTEPATAQCSSPAPLQQYQQHAPGYIVHLRDGIDLVAAVNRYEARYGFRANDVWPGLGSFFIRAVSPRTITALRCEPEVEWISENGISSGG